MANKLEYEIVGRYMNGAEVTGYHMHVSNGKASKYTREQVCYLVGKDQVVNCDGQLYQDKVLLRGKGVSLESLPVISDKDGSLSRTDNLGKIRKGTSAQDAIAQLTIVKSITQGRNTVGYVVRSSGGVEKRAKREQVMELASQGKIGNATVQKNNGQLLLRGVGCNLNELPTVSINADQNSSSAQQNDEKHMTPKEVFKASTKIVFDKILESYDHLNSLGYTDSTINGTKFIRFNFLVGNAKDIGGYLLLSNYENNPTSIIACVQTGDGDEAQATYPLTYVGIKNGLLYILHNLNQCRLLKKSYTYTV